MASIFTLGAAATTDWWAVGTNIAAAVANFVVAGIAVWAVWKQRRDQLSDQAKDQTERIRDQLAAAELAAYQVQTTYWQLDAGAKSREIGGFASGSFSDYTLFAQTLETRADVLAASGGGRLPIPLRDHALAVLSLVRQAREVLVRHNGVDDPTFGRAVVGDLLMLRHRADIEQETNARLCKILLGLTTLPSGL